MALGLVLAFDALGLDIVWAVWRGVIRRVREHHRIIEEEWLLLLAGDKIQRVAADQVRPVFVVRVIDLPAVDFQAGVLVAARPAVELPQAILVEAEMPRPLVTVTQLPLARDARRIARRFEQVSKRLLRRVEVAEAGVVPLVAQARHQGHAGGRAERLHVALFKTHAGRGEPVHHGRLVALAAVSRDTFVAEVIDQDQHDVRLSLGGGERGAQRGENRDEDRQPPHVDSFAPYHHRHSPLNSQRWGLAPTAFPRSSIQSTSTGFSVAGT